jgi:hypothetical protein
LTLQAINETERKEKAMVIALGPELEAALNEAARREGTAPDALALDVLRERFLGTAAILEPRDEWERGLLEAARPWEISFADAALSREELYD